MEVIKINYINNLPAHLRYDYYNKFLPKDTNPCRGDYEIDRGFEEILRTIKVPFNPLAHIGELVGHSNEPVTICEGGCGIGNALVDIKKGILIEPQPFSVSDEQLSELERWKKSLFEKRWGGFGSRVHTTGITLTSTHVRVAKAVPEEYQVDRMIVSCVSKAPLDFTYDFIFDWYGPAYYYPELAFPYYAQVLKEGGLALFRTVKGKRKTVRDVIATYASLNESGFEVVMYGGLADFVVKNTGISIQFSLPQELKEAMEYDDKYGGEWF